MRDKYTEAIDKEIGALEDGKDALQEANDERQRELDLIEARNNLENAKKRKVWVYSDDGGFKQVQDEKAVNEAAEKYRDVLTEIQVAEIDKEIELREKQKKALEESVKGLTDLESNINDAMTVEQAKAALGLTDEKDLLNLPDAVNDGIKNGLADSMLQKEAEENKNNEKYKQVSLDDILKSMGATVSAEDLEEVKNNIVTASQYKAQNALANNLKQATDTAVTNIVNNNGNTINNTFNINGVNDPNEIKNVIHNYMTEVFTNIGNTIKT